MAPMTRAVTDAYKDGFVLVFGFGKGFFTPRVPINRIIFVLL
jgi:hypothetical protein